MRRATGFWSGLGYGIGVVAYEWGRAQNKIAAQKAWRKNRIAEDRGHVGGFWEDAKRSLQGRCARVIEQDYIARGEPAPSRFGWRDRLYWFFYYTRCALAFSHI